VKTRPLIGEFFIIQSYNEITAHYIWCNMKFPAWYGISVGSLIILQWLFFLTTNSVPELETTPWAIGSHIAAEILLAVTLLIGGIATLRSKPWGKSILQVALGMAVYSEINSPGYFAQLGQWSLVGIFAVLLVGAIASARMLLNKGTQL
jgi:hypothetical protein